MRGRRAQLRSNCHDTDNVQHSKDEHRHVACDNIRVAPVLTAEYTASAYSTFSYSPSRVPLLICENDHMLCRLHRKIFESLKPLRVAVQLWQLAPRPWAGVEHSCFEYSRSIQLFALITAQLGLYSQSRPAQLLLVTFSCPRTAPPTRRHDEQPRTSKAQRPVLSTQRRVEASQRYHTRFW